MISGIQIIIKANELCSAMSECRNGCHNSVMAYKLQIVESTIQKIFVTWVVFMEAIFPCLNLKPDDEFYLTACLRFLTKLDMASQTL